MTEIQKNFIERSKELRNGRSFKQMELLTKIPASTIERVERGTNPPKFDMIYAYHVEFGVSFDWMFGISDDRNTSKGNTASASGTHGVAIASSGTVHNNQPDKSLSERVSYLETMFVKLMSKLDI